MRHQPEPGERIPFHPVFISNESLMCVIEKWIIVASYVQINPVVHEYRLPIRKITSPKIDPVFFVVS